MKERDHNKVVVRKNIFVHLLYRLKEVLLIPPFARVHVLQLHGQRDFLEFSITRMFVVATDMRATRSYSTGAGVLHTLFFIAPHKKIDSV